MVGACESTQGRMANGDIDVGSGNECAKWYRKLNLNAHCRVV
jgi:hypothetical protein